jgi:hypothetical protein
MKSLKQHLALTLSIIALSVFAYSSVGYAGLFGGDINVKFNRKVPSEVNLGNINRIAIVQIDGDRDRRIDDRMLVGVWGCQEAGMDN